MIQPIVSKEGVCLAHRMHRPRPTVQVVGVLSARNRFVPIVVPLSPNVSRYACLPMAR